MEEVIANSLKEYWRKRDFSVTPEPVGKIIKGKNDIFVIQFHKTKRNPKNPHYDLRLEWDGVLESWAIPKFDQIGKKGKVLAIQVEPHPIEYADFEGEIPEGYGAGIVKIYDKGKYKTLDKTRDKWTFELYGDKVKGKFSLIRTHGNRWLLVKSKEVKSVKIVVSNKNQYFRGLVQGSFNDYDVLIKGIDSKEEFEEISKKLIKDYVRIKFTIFQKEM